MLDACAATARRHIRASADCGDDGICNTIRLKVHDGTRARHHK
jgi:hypothetical protein